jgi:hypothetical protein
VHTGNSFSQGISELTRRTTYYFLVQGKNSAGEGSWGSTPLKQFTTPPDLPTVTTQSATGITETGATLNGTMTDDGGQASQFRFRYKPSSGSYTYTSWSGSKSTGQSFSQSLTGLTGGITYYFAAQGKNDAGEGSWGSELSFTTPPPAPEIQKPTVATQPATEITATTATLHGTVTNDGGEACQYQFR